MRGNRKKVDSLFFGLCIILILLCACGGGSNTSSETGSIAFSVEWRGAPQESSGRYAAALDCDAAGVATVVAEVYDESSLYLTSGGPWLCSAHTGTIQNVPVGTDRTAVVLGKDINGDVLYRGEQSGITVIAGDTTDAGTIVVELFNPALNPPVLISPTNGETVTSGSFSFQWNPVYGASEYQIQVSTDSNFTSTVIDETVTTAYYTPTITLSAGTYYWRLRAEDSYGNQSAWSEVWSFIVATQPGVAPSTPTGVTPTAGDEEVTISWDSVTGATSYNIYWSTTPGATKDTGTKITAFSSPYTHTGLNNGTTYYYVVTAENDYGESGESDEVSATPSSTGSAPSTPTTVTATPGDEEVTISWDTASGATSYNIYWSTTSGVSKDTYEDKISSITTTSYLHTDLTNGTTYYYVVTAENDYGESGESDEVSATPSVIGSAPSTPTGVTPTAGDEEVTISWDSVSDATSYNIYWSTSQGVTKDTGTKISAFSSPYTHTGLTNSTTYYYVVTAENDYGESDESDEVSATPQSTGNAPSTPTTVTATAGDEDVTISWDSVSDATSYKIYMQTSSGVSKANFTEKRTVTTTSYTWTGLSNDTTYYYVVTAENDYGESSESDEVSATPPAPAYPYTVLDTIPVGDHPQFVAVNPNGSYVYVSNVKDDTVSVIQTSDNTVVDTIPVGDGPYDIAVAPNGSYVYVANFRANTVSVIRTSDNTVIDTISVGNYPLGVAVTPNGSYVYVTRYYGNKTVSVIQTSDNTVIDTIPVGDHALLVGVTPNGSYVYVTNQHDDTVSVIQTSDNTVVDTIPVGDGPYDIAVAPNGSYVYLANELSNTVSVIQTSDNSVIDTIPVGDHPLFVAATPNGSYVYVTNWLDNTVSVIQTSDNTVVDTIPVGDHPLGVAIAPNGSYVYVTNELSNTVSVIGF